MDKGERIINGIISAGLFHAECCENPDHGCIIKWSSGAAEQIEALAADPPPEKGKGSLPDCEVCENGYLVEGTGDTCDFCGRS